jgi:hypothetical protein
MSNTHIATAKFRQEGVHEWQSDWGSTDATNIAAALDAQAEATLALTYEQRTANLIALFRVSEDAVPALHVGGMKDAAWVEAARQIAERLDLA